LVTLRDIARETGLSVNTISRALNGKPDVNPETRQRVESVAKQLGYVPNSIARSLVGGQSCTIGLIIADLQNPFYSKVAQGVEEAARAEGYSTILVNTNERESDERQAVQVLRSKRVDGMLIHPTQGESEHICQLRNDGIPFVLINRHIDEVNPDYIINNNQKGAYMAVRHLLELGHKRVLHISGPERISSVQERIVGYKQALSEFKIPFDEKMVVHTLLNMQSSYETTLRVFESGLAPTAIYTYSDLLAIGTFKALRELNKKVPDDISLVGYDDIDFAAFLEVPLTTVRQQMYEIGRQAVKLLIKIIHDASYVPGKYKVVLDPELIVRRSTAKVAQQ